MMMLPQGRQCFVLIKSRDMFYADRTNIICQLTEDCDQCFINRPHFFGTSLMLTSLGSLFSK